MNLEEKAIEEFKSKMDGSEQLQETILTFYECEVGFSGMVGIANGPTPIKGILGYSNKQLLFYGEMFKKVPISFQIPSDQIAKIKEKKQPFTLFKSVPSFVVFHQNDQVTFTTRGDQEEFAKLKLFFDHMLSMFDVVSSS
ncbi:hypothetical protein HOO54_10745 [Bacillus sp. WMMC1349]|uniref:hypothetical protein n=1 Tax=Bacillus sp. WMMC1349 TaxID=2736254 RepID=UPI001555CABD|nr:hypothetical protein [Bacillus sp. WMMC1349]NPC92693.1 hypothetical protein [Bacillus sp. WMMC1349]